MKQGYQPKKCNTKNIVPPSVLTNVKPKKEGYTWEDLDKAWWEGFDNAKNKMGKRITELEKENAEYKEVFGSCDTCKRTCDIGNCCDPRTKNGYLLDKVKVIVERQKLLKENAELKESNKMLEQGYIWHDYDAGEDCYEDSHESRWVKRDEIYQLTKAKKLLAEWVELYKPKLEGYPITPIQEQTELFLNEVEK